LPGKFSRPIDGAADEMMMSGKTLDNKPVARLPKGMRDIEAEEIRGIQRMLATIREVYESYGFEPLDTPAFEYTDCLGKFLPDQDRPNEGVFSFQDEDEQWLSLRYDLTAPLARYVAQNFDKLPKPFRRYQTGPVWRNEKPGPGRFRQFTQFDADTVGTESIAADAELCMLTADVLRRLEIPSGSYLVNVSSRKVLDGILETIGVDGEGHASTRLTILRTIDKKDRLGIGGVKQLLGPGREDESGAFTKGAGLDDEQVERIVSFFAYERTHGSPVETDSNLTDADVFEIDGKRFQTDNEETLAAWERSLRQSAVGLDGVSELREMLSIWKSAGFGSQRIQLNPGVVRGLEYYTGPVFEAELTFSVSGEDEQSTRFGSVGGGGRYDGLVGRFKGTKVPATGFSIGVSRLYTALQTLGQLKTEAASGPVVILAMDRDRVGDYARMAQTLRREGIRAELYLGTSGMKAQMKYADKRGSPCVVIQGSDEHARGEVTIKDLIEGERLSGQIADNQAWREGRPAQFSVKESEMVEAVRSVIARHKE
jgi:histidyl-tRNA synthetase